MSESTIILLNFGINLDCLIDLNDLLNAHSARLSDIWFGNPPCCDLRHRESYDCIFHFAPFQKRLIVDWNWRCSVGQPNLALGENVDGQEGYWPELRSEYGFMTTVFGDSISMRLPIKWGYFLNEKMLWETVTETVDFLGGFSILK